MLVAGIVATAFTVRGATIMAANQTADRPAYQSFEARHMSVRKEHEEAAKQRSESSEVLDAKMLDTRTIVEPALEAIGKHALRKVVL